MVVLIYIIRRPSGSRSILDSPKICSPVLDVPLCWDGVEAEFARSMISLDS